MDNKIEQGTSNSYIGWVPCVSGKLLFQFTSCDAISNHGYINANNVEPDLASNKVISRYLVIATEVNWKDLETHEEGVWNVVLIASAPLSSKKLTGKVFLIPAQKSIWNEEIQPILKEIATQIQEKNEIQLSSRKIEDILDNAINESVAYGAKFELKDSGITYLSLLPHITKPTKPETEFLICRQCYYYIKYTFHKDKHHAPSESLTTIHLLDKQKAEIGTELIGDLKDAIVALKRNCEPSKYKTYFSSKGILSYGKSLAMTCKNEGFLSENEHAAEKVFIDSMGESLEVTGKKIEAELQARANYNVGFRSICLFILAIIAPFTIIFREKIENKINISSENHILNILSWFVGSEWHAVLTALVVVVIYFIAKYLQLTYGSLNLALGKVNLIAKGIFEYVVEDIKSAETLLMYVYFLTLAALLALLFTL